MLSSDVVQAVKATRASVLVNSYILNYQDLSTISIRTLPLGFVYEATIVDKPQRLRFLEIRGLRDF